MQVVARTRRSSPKRTFDATHHHLVLHEALRLMRATQPASIVVVEEIAPVPTITGAANRLHQVIVNLMTTQHRRSGMRRGRSR